MSDDPFMPGSYRFPMNPLCAPISDAQPSAARPFVLRHARPVGVVEVKHRTPATKRKIPQETHVGDGHEGPVTKDDSYFVPDD
ncbi:MAG: hypothetical protein ACRDT0_22795 [Pseudonocardiaceae bacterium]